MAARVHPGFFLLALCLSSGPAQAGTVSWSYYNGLWSVGTNWSSTPNPPANGDDVQIIDPWGFYINWDITYDNGLGNAQVFNSLTLGSTQGSTVTLTQADPFILQSQTETVGLTGLAVFSQSGGTNTVTNTLTLGDQTGSSDLRGYGTYVLSGAGSLSANNETVGNSGIGAFTQSGGFNILGGSLIVGNSPTGSGTYDLSGGSLSATVQQIGNSGIGAFTQSGGAPTSTVDSSWVITQAAEAPTS
jgi:hypothetical protein